MRFAPPVSFADISVVLQGPVQKDFDSITGLRVTQAACKELRRLLPGAEIILTTWRGSDLNGLDYDRIVENEDPGSTKSANWPAFMNTNRMFCSLKAGIAAASRKCVLRCRTDQILTSAGFLEAFNLDDRSAPAPTHLFARRLIITNIYSSNPNRSGVVGLFHISDMAAFGLKQDVAELYNVPLIDPQFDPASINPLFSHPGKRLVPEQYIGMLNFCKAGLPTPGEQSGMKELIRMSEEFLVANFLILPFSSYGLRWPNRRFPLISRYGVYTPMELKRMYSGRPATASLPAVDAILPEVVYFFEKRARAKMPGIYNACKAAYRRFFTYR